MSNLKQKVSYKVMALFMAVLMLVSMIPATVIAYALDTESPYKAKNFTAVYNAETDSVDMTWDAFETEPYELWLCVDTLKTTQLDVAATEHSYSVVAGGETTYSLLAFADDADVEGVESDRIGVTGADTLTSISSFDAVEVENNLTITEIIAKLPTTANVVTDTLSTPTEYGNNVQWNAEGTSYDQSKSEEQTITISGLVVLDAKELQNRNNISLNCSIDVTVKAAVDVSITSDLDDSASIEKKVGESLALSVEATGTAPKYQWYKKTAEATEGTAIDGETAATLNISSLALTDAAQYYCVITGKNNSMVTSKIATVDVTKNDVDLQLSISPSAGQTRPNPIEIEVLNVPNDAKGTVTIKQDENEIHNVTLDGSNSAIKYTFTATGSSDSFVFSAYYSGDDEKYNADDVTGVAYDFTKGTQNKPTINDVPSDVKALDTFTITASGVDTADGKYTITVSNPAIAEINQIADNKATIKVLKKGEFTITAIANGNDDYNASEPTTVDVNAGYAERTGLKFNSSTATQAYVSNFSFTMGYKDSSFGDTTPVFSIDWTGTTAKGVDIDPATGRIFYTDDANSYKTDFTGTVGTVKVVVTKSTEGIYKTISDTYTLEITKGTQALLGFSTSTPNAITYTEIDSANGKVGTKFTNPMSDTQKGTVNSVLSYEVTGQKTLENASTTGVVDIDSSTGEITALKSGVVEVTATLPGNSMYEETNCSYTITVKRGDITTAENATGDNSVFNFDVADKTIKYGFNGFVNVAVGGQSDSTDTVEYADNSDELDVAQNGVITFNKAPADAATETYTVTITATKPQTDKYNKCTVEYVLTVERDAVKPATDFKVNNDVIKDATKLTSPDGWYNATHTNITITPSGDYTQISENGTDWKSSIERTADSKHAIAFYLKDEEGNTSLISNQNINYDTKQATAKLTLDENNFWDKFLETITFGIYRPSAERIKIVANDNLSGIMSIEYYEQQSNFKDVKLETTIDDIVKDIEWKPCSITRDELSAETTVDIKAETLGNKKVVLFAKVTDYAGNISYFRTDGILFDNITPEPDVSITDKSIVDIDVKLSETDTAKEGLYNKEVPFSVVVTDAKNEAGVTSGVENIKVTISGKGGDGTAYSKVIEVHVKEPEMAEFNSANISNSVYEVKVDGEDVTDNFENIFVVPDSFDSNYLTILVEANDYAKNANSNANEITRLAIDKSIPVIEVTYDDDENTFSNEKYIGNDKNRVATITIEELNFDNSAVKITVKKDGEDLNIAPNFVAVEKTEKVNPFDENGDQILWTMDIDYATLGEGDFEFDIAYTDKAKNSNVGWTGDKVAVNKNFTIDNTKPVITVEITNDDVKNNKYFAADRKATVTITERNFDENYKFNWDGLTYALDGEVKTAPTPKIVKSDEKTYIRVYEIDFSVEGDYTFDVKYTDLADNLADTYSCSSVSYKEFTVDKTAPALEITGVADKSANNGDVAPVVTYSDINFNKDAVSIVLSGINNGKVDYKGNSEDHEDKHGQTYTYDNFEKVQKVDDIYTLTAKLTDMAGNETEKTITFSANRFGSVYDLSNVEDIISKYLKVEEDIVFTETNVDSLDRDGIKIKLTKNGTPSDLVEGTDYTVEVTGGNGQWSVYKYTVKKALFADDGRYSLSIYSKDAAGNINENIDETKSAEISFGIDKTNPVIVPIDFEDGGRYDEETKKVSVEIKDNLVLESVKIYLNGDEIDYEVNGETYTFKIGESNSKQNVKIVAVDAAGNEQPLEVKDFVVNTNFFIQWYYNTGLFVGSIIGVVALALGITIFLVFFKKKKEDEEK